MSKNQENKEEEVDLGSLFLVIGNGFKNFFNFIWKIFTGIFNFIIEILLFVKGNIIKLAVAGIIGGGIGTYQEFNEEGLFGADLTVQPNFKSSRQLYNTIGYYNNLISKKKPELLAKTFNITPSQAEAIKRFEVTPIKTDNDKIELYHEMVKLYDTVATVNYSFDDFKRSFTDFDYKNHIIHVESTDSDVFSYLGDVIISSIVDNEYFNKVKNLKRESLFRKDSLLKENLVQIDTLRQVYMKVMLEEAKKNNAEGTSIDLGGQQTSSKEVQLFQTNRSLNNDLDRVSDQISEKSEVINVVSNFQKVGYRIGGIKKNSIVIFAFLGIFLMISILLLVKLNRYLESYKKE